MRANKKEKVFSLLFILLLGLGVGYAVLSSNLTIEGTSLFKKATFDIHFEDVSITSGSVTPNSGPTIGSNLTSVSYNITLTNPGDFFEFTVDAVNGGTIDAMISSITSKMNGEVITTLPNYMEYSVTYSDGITIANNHLLASNDEETYKVRVAYKDDIPATDLPGDDTTSTFQFSVNYVQADDSGTEIGHPITKYTVNLYDSNVTGNNLIWLGQSIPNNITQYSSASEALAAIRTATSDNNIQFYLKHTIQGGVVTDSYVEFIVTSAMASSNSGMTAGTYVLIGSDTYDENASSTDHCKAEYYNSSTGKCLSPHYATNKATLLSAFGSSNCTEYSSDFVCAVSDLYADVTTPGTVGAGDDDWSCIAYRDGSSRCDQE